MKQMNIDIKYISKEIDKLEYIDSKSDWIDLRAAKTISIEAGKSAIIPLGVAMKIPDGYEAIIAPRSSLFKKTGLIQTNSIGIIDNSYSGDNDEWKLSVYATKDCTIELNDRIAQFRIFENQPHISFNEVNHLSDIDRGGFGSTGIK